MQRDDAVRYLKDVLQSNNLIVPSAISIENPKDGLGYKVYIKGMRNELAIRQIAKEHHLAVEEQNGVLIIYKPIGF